MQKHFFKKSLTKTALQELSHSGRTYCSPALTQAGKEGSELVTVYDSQHILGSVSKEGNQVNSGYPKPKEINNFTSHTVTLHTK